MVSQAYIGCVYRATHVSSGTIYIGKTIKGLAVRYSQHVKRAGIAPGHFSNAIAKHGVESFRWDILYLSNDDDALCQAEIAIISECRKEGASMYNMTDGGQGVAGAVRTPEWLAAMSRSLKGKVTSQERRDAHSAKMKGRKRDPKAVESAAAKLRGRKQSPEHVAKRLKALQGRPVTQETRDKISAYWAKRRLDKLTSSS